MTAGQRVVAPQGCGGTLVDAFNGARRQGHINGTETLGDTGIAGSITLPELTAALQVQSGNAPLIAGDIQRLARQQQATVDVDHAFQLRTTLRDRYALFPHRHAVGDVHGNHFTGRQASHREAVGHDRRTGTTQGQYRRRAVIDPATVTGGGIQADQTIVLGLNHHDVTVVGWRCQYFAGHASAPLFFTVDRVQGNDFTLDRTNGDQTVSYANGAGDRQLEVFLPFDVAGVAVHRHQHASDVGGIDGIAIDGRNQHVVGFALTVTDRTTPLLLQNHFFLEVDQFGRRQFFFAVAAATRGQQGQSQQCCMFPTNHVTHPLWPGRPA
ncbi:hypothetical protein D3C87_1139510 [compost metagenome]